MKLDPEDGKDISKVFYRAPPGLLYYFLEQLRLMYLPEASNEQGVVQPDAHEDLLDIQIEAAGLNDGKTMVAIDSVLDHLAFYAAEVTVADLNELIPKAIGPDHSIVSLSYHNEMNEEESATYDNAKEKYLSGTWSEALIGGRTSRKDFLVRRDETWRKKMIAAIDGGPTFIAVGLTHVMRKGGLLDALRRRPDVTVTPYKELDQGERPRSCKAASKHR